MIEPASIIAYDVGMKTQIDVINWREIAGAQKETIQYWRGQVAERDAEIARLREASGNAYRAIVLGNGREIDWNAIADELRAALEGSK